MTSLQTGTTTAKPVIHGMYGNRVLIMNNGVRQSGQQWGEDHAPEVDVEGNNHIQVIKGAEAVRYGAEAMAGAIVMEQAGSTLRRGVAPRSRRGCLCYQWSSGEYLSTPRGGYTLQS